MSGNEVRLVVTGSDRSGPAFDGADKSVKKLDDSVTELDKSIGGLGETTADTKEDVKGLGDENEKTTKSVYSFKEASAKLNAEIATSKQRIKELQQQRALLGAGEEGVPLFSDISKEERNLKSLKRLLEDLSGEFTDLDKTVVDTSQDVKGLGDQTEKTVKSVYSFKEASTRLNAEIEITKQRIKELQQQRSMGSGGDDDSLFGDISKQEAKLKSLKHIFEDLTSEATKTGGQAGRGFMGAFSSAFEGTAGTPVLGPIIVTAIVTAAAAAAAVVGPLIGGIVAGGITAAVGGGALAAGIFAATQDDRVQIAMSGLSDQFINEMKDIGIDFVQPVLSGIEIISKGLEDLDIAETFSKATPAVEMLAKGVVAFATNIWPGLNKALDEAGPIFQAVEEGLGEVGAGLGDLIGELAESDGAVDGLRELFAILKLTLEGTGATLGWLSDRFHETNRVMAVMYDLTGKIADLFGLDDVAEGSRKTADSVREFAADGTKAIHGIGDAAKESLDPFARYLFEASHNADALTKSLQELFGVQMTLDEATIHYEESIDKLTEAVKENGKTLDVGTEKGRAVREAVLGEIQAAADLRDATIKKTGATAEANNTYVAQIELLKKQAIALGLSKAEIDKIVGNYVITLTTIYKTIGSKPKINPGNRSAASDEILGNAAGGVASGGNSGWTWTGEQGPELVRLPQGSMVYPAGQSQQMAAQAGGGGGTTLVLESDGTRVSDFLIEMLREGIRQKTGGNVQRAIGSNASNTGARGA